MTFPSSPACVPAFGALGAGPSGVGSPRCAAPGLEDQEGPAMRPFLVFPLHMEISMGVWRVKEGPAEARQQNR